MKSDDAVAALIDALDDLEIPYMVTGSIASNYYGVFRATKDADFVVEMRPPDLGRLIERLGPAFQVDRQLSLEGVTTTSRHKIRVADSNFSIELFMVSEEPHDHERFSRRRKLDLGGKTVCLPTPEDVIITKLRWASIARRPKDLGDLKNVLAVQGDALDWSYIDRWCQIHDTADLLKQIRAQIPPRRP